MTNIVQPLAPFAAWQAVIDAGDPEAAIPYSLAPADMVTMPTSGEVFAMVAIVGDPITAGSISMRPTINGVPVGDLQSLTSAAPVMTFRTPGAAFPSMAVLGVNVEADAAMVPVQLFLSVTLYVVLSRVSTDDGL